MTDFYDLCQEVISDLENEDHVLYVTDRVSAAFAFDSDGVEDIETIQEILEAVAEDDTCTADVDTEEVEQMLLTRWRLASPDHAAIVARGVLDEVSEEAAREES